MVAFCERRGLERCTSFNSPFYFLSGGERGDFHLICCVVQARQFGLHAKTRSPHGSAKDGSTVSDHLRVRSQVTSVRRFIFQGANGLRGVVRRDEVQIRLRSLALPGCDGGPSSQRVVYCRLLNNYLVFVKDRNRFVAFVLRYFRRFQGSQVETALINVVPIVVRGGFFAGTRRVLLNFLSFKRYALGRFISTIARRRIVKDSFVDQVSRDLRDVVHAVYRVNGNVRWDAVRVRCCRFLRVFVPLYLQRECKWFDNGFATVPPADFVVVIGKGARSIQGTPFSGGVLWIYRVTAGERRFRLGG